MLDRTIPPSILEPENLNLHLPDCRTMRNGMPLYILNLGESDVIRMDLVIKAGSWLQSQSLQALFTNRMLREGTRSYTAAVIAEKLDYYGAMLQLTVSSEYAYVTLYSLTKYLAETLAVVESLVKEPLFPDKELGIIKENNIRQFQINRKKVDFLAHRSLMRALYGVGHPCGRYPEEPDYQCITPALLRSFYDKFYHSGNCLVFLSGKVSEESICLVETTLGNEPFGKTAPLAHNEIPLPMTSADKRIFVEREDAMQSAVRMGMLSIDKKHPDYLKLNIVSTLLGGYFGSRLMSNIREEKGYTYHISASLLSYPDSGLFVINAETDNEFVEPLIKEVYREIDRLHQEPVGEQELNMVKNYMLGDMCRNFESAFSLADNWTFILTANLPFTYPEEMWQSVREITSAEVQDLAIRYLHPEKLIEVVSGKVLKK